MKKYVVTIRVDGRNFETKPFYASCETEALHDAEIQARLSFESAEDVDAVNVEEIEQEVSNTH